MFISTWVGPNDMVKKKKIGESQHQYKASCQLDLKKKLNYAYIGAKDALLIWFFFTYFLR